MLMNSGANIVDFFLILTKCHEYLSQFNNSATWVNGSLRLTLRLLNGRQN